MRTPPLRVGAPLARYTTFGIGGPARLLADVPDSERLRAAIVWAERCRTRRREAVTAGS